MKFLLASSLLVIIFQLPVVAQEQSDKTRTDYNKLYKSVMDEYGFDQVLVNGILYEDKYRRKIGHQFLLEDQLYTGTLVYKGEEYKDVEMKYDIFGQQLILCLKNNNSIAWIVPSNDFVSAFSIGDKYFSKYNFGEVPEYYQVVFEKGKLKCLYYWFKEKHDSNKLNYSGYNEFSESEKENFLILDGLIKKYKNNRSFTELFPVEVRAHVKEYINSNHINVAGSSDERIKELLTYCISLL
jgi:hypothetical protein